MTEPQDAARVSEAINTLAAFCGPRDVPALTRESLTHLGWDQADVVLFFGGSILSGAETVATAIREKIATATMLVGGQGHTTQTLRDRASNVLWSTDVAGMSEAEIFQNYLGENYSLQADLLETRSTNCGSNIAAALKVLAGAGLPAERVVLIQDATMQRRMDAGLRRALPSAAILNFASYTARVRVSGGSLRYGDTPEDAWPLPRFVSMLLGEIERLRDDTSGYGPRGKGWIAHVEIPEAVEAAYRLVKTTGRYSPRDADPQWSS